MSQDMLRDHDSRINKLESSSAELNARMDNLAKKIDRFANATMGLVITVVGGLIVTVVGGLTLAFILYFLGLGGA